MSKVEKVSLPRVDWAIDKFLPRNATHSLIIEALFICFQIQHKIWKFCMKFGDLISCNQMPDFTAKNPNSVSVGGPSQTLLETLQRSPDLLTEFKGATSKGLEEKGWEMGGWEGRGREERGRDPQGLVHTPMSDILKKTPWLQNWSHRRGRQHRRLPQAANTPAPPTIFKLGLYEVNSVIRTVGETDGRKVLSKTSFCTERRAGKKSTKSAGKALLSCFERL